MDQSNLFPISSIVRTVRKPEFLQQLIKIALIVTFIGGNLLQLGTGLADNGDFSRIMTWFTSGPTDFHQNWPTKDDPEWQLRFFYYWIPNWKIDFSVGSRIFSSVLFLWFPGVLFNYFFFSQETLLIPIVSLFPRLLCLLFLWLILKWIDSRSKYKTLYYLTIGLPYVLMMITTDYAAYFNSFYQEPASMVFLFLLFTLLIIKDRIPQNPIYLSIAFIVVFLLTTAKASNIYWPIISLPFLLGSFLWERRRNLNIGIYAYILAFLLIPTFVAYAFTRVPGKDNAYESLFMGVLKFSADPAQRLADIGIDDPTAVDCRVSFYSETGQDCFQKYQDKVSFVTSLKIILHEPTILLREAEYAGTLIQDIDVSYLGKYAYNDHIARRFIRLNLWSYIKRTIFPQGGLFYIFLLGSGIILWVIRKKNPLSHDLALVGGLTLIGVVADLSSSILGAGTADVIKHLFFSNFLFDILLIITVNAVVETVLLTVRARKSRAKLEPAAFG